MTCGVAVVTQRIVAAGLVAGVLTLHDIARCVAVVPGLVAADAAAKHVAVAGVHIPAADAAIPAGLVAGADAVPVR